MVTDCVTSEIFGREDEAWERDEVEILSLMVLMFSNGRSNAIQA